MTLSDFKIAHNSLAPVSGRVLIAEPFMKAEPFRRSVVLLCGDKKAEHIGFVLNKPTGYSLNDILKEPHPHFNIPLHIGGPVSTKHLLFVHTLNSLSEAVPVANGLYLDGNFDEMLDHIREHGTEGFQVRFFVGYSGWSQGQLSEEIKKDSWLVSHIDLPAIFDTNNQTLWKNCLSQLGEKYRRWSDFPLNPSWN